MRKWAFLNEPYAYNGDHVCKIMVYETGKEGVYVFLYNSKHTQFCFADEWYQNSEDALKKWESLISGTGWNVISDPGQGCQDDCILPIRVKGRNIGKPEWGKYELFDGNSWVAYRE